MKLTDNLYVYVYQGNDNNCNSYIFANVLIGNKHILIDPGHIVTPYLTEPAYQMLEKAITGDALKVEDIGIVLITHAHPDHVEAARKIQEKSQALLAMHKMDEPMYRAIGGGKIDIYLEEGQLKKDNLVQSKLEVYHTPGHSQGEVCLYWPEKKALAVGDVIFFMSTGRTDLPGGDSELLKTSIEKISKLDTEYLLCGHPYSNPGVIQGKEMVQKNIRFVLENFW